VVIVTGSAARPQQLHPRMDRDLERRSPPLRLDQDHRPDLESIARYCTRI